MICEYDRQLFERFKLFYKNNGKIYKNFGSNNELEEIIKILFESLMNTIQCSLSFELIKKLFIFDMSRKIYSSNETNKKLFEVYNNFNHDTAIFIVYSGFFSYKKVSQNNEIGINDLTDMYHLLYLKNDQIIVTDDNNLRNTMKIVYPCNVVNKEQLLERLKESVA
jgi:sulfur relay (sulfurtransferase) DsrF/TusC family protein